jgi:membrane protein DedA with SNARE-associated domain
VEHLLDTYGYLAVFAFIFIESCGIPVPGEIMLITAAAYAGTGHMQIPLVIAAAIAGGFFGFIVSYTVGRKGGRAIVDRYGPRIHLEPATMERAEALFARYGDLTVFIGRFVAVLRAWAAFLAGLNRMPFFKFLLYNLGGAVVWATLYGVLAFEFGKPLIDLVVHYVSIAGLILVVVVAAYLIYRWRFRSARAVGP